ncbi:YwiC-like family protein [Evansella clarkii]|jgi:cation transport ATPase|uniref:YwiC-like family protein n=1 Tax=Evansella clarkii TaxID=79879 RepID=UPI0009971ABB|nr:YwiC-like family protein [Evansella clarkii]
MKWYIPREHGAWAMLIVPYWIGAAISGLHWAHFVFFAGLFAAYFAQAPLLTYIRNPKHKDVWPSFFIYISAGLLLTVPFIINNPALLLIGLAILPLFLLNIYFARTKRERLFINDLIAIIALSSLLLMAYRLTEPALQLEAFFYLFVTVLFFTASVFHVKSLIREKKNQAFHKKSLIYHSLVVAVPLLMQLFFVSAAFLVSLLKTLFVPKKYLRRPMQIGIVEIVNSALFFIIIVGAYYM